MITVLCKQCGNEIPDGTKFCPHCGTPSNVPEQVVNNQPPIAPAPKKRKKGCLISFIVVFAFFIIAVIGGIIAGVNGDVGSKNKPDLIVNGLDYAGKSVKEMQALVGNLKDGGNVNLTNTAGKTVKGKVYYLSDSDTSFTFVKGKLVSFQFYASDPVKYKKEKDIIQMFGITPAENMKQEANTGVALRYSSVSDKVSDFWIQEMDSKAKTFSIVKITFDSALAGKFANEPEKDDLEILEYKDTNDGYVRYVTGKVKNNTNKKYSYVHVSINLYKDENLLGSTMANANNLGPGEIWEFSAPILYDNCNNYKIADVIGY